MNTSYGALVAFATGIVTSLLGAEIHAHGPHIAKRLVSRAAKLKPSDEQQDFKDELDDLIDCYAADGRNLAAVCLSGIEFYRALRFTGIDVLAHSPSQPRRFAIGGSVLFVGILTGLVFGAWASNFPTFATRTAVQIGFAVLAAAFFVQRYGPSPRGAGTAGIVYTATLLTFDFSISECLPVGIYLSMLLGLRVRRSSRARSAIINGAIAMPVLFLLWTFNLDWVFFATASVVFMSWSDHGRNLSPQQIVSRSFAIFYGYSFFIGYLYHLNGSRIGVVFAMSSVALILIAPRLGSRAGIETITRVRQVVAAGTQ